MNINIFIVTEIETEGPRTTRRSHGRFTTVAPTTKPECRCDEIVPIGVQDGRVQDDQITATSTLINIKGPR